MKKRIFKRGDVTSKTLFFLFEVLLVIVIMVALLNYVNSIKDKTFFEKKHLSRDLSLLTNTLSVAPDNVFYSYSNPNIGLDSFNFYFIDNIIEVKQTDEDSRPESFFYAQNNLLINKVIHIKAEKKLAFIKSGITLFTKQDNNLNKISFIKFEQKITNKKIIIDPQDGATGDITDKIFIISGHMKQSNPNSFELTRDDKTISDGINDRKNTINNFGPHAVISITINSYQKDKNYIKAYYDIETNEPEKTKQLASFILNSVSDKFNDGTIDGVSIIPVNLKHIKDDKTKEILNNDKTIIVLEIGNINSVKGKKMLSQDISKIGSAIVRGVDSYFK
jgi:hypothetical protein